jgi:hypothetical protein
MMKHKTLMEGVVPGISKGVKKPVVDGIVSGVPVREAKKGTGSIVERVGGSSTRVPKAAFGAGLTPDYKMGK